MNLESWFRRDRFAAGAGVRLEEVRPGYARARLRLGRRHLNANGLAMGGAVFTLADFAFAACSNARGKVAVSIQANLSFARPATGLLTAVARETARSRRLSTCEVKVSDAAGALVAAFHGLAFVKDDDLPLPAASRTPRTPAPRMRRRRS